MRLSPKWTCSRRIVALLVLLGALGNNAYSQTDRTRQDQLKQLSLEQLGDVEVTSQSKAPEAVWKTAAAIFVITQEDIRRSGATSIPEALRLAPGVEVSRISSDKWSIGIRGFGSRLARSVLVLIDGRSVYTTLLAGTYWEVQDTVMEDIDRIEVIRGPGGTVWGPNAVDGVINVITKNSAQTQGGLVTLGGGDVEQGFVNVRYGGSNAKGLSYRIYGKGFNRGPEDHTDLSNYDRWAAVQGGFRMDWIKDQRDSFTLQGDLYDERAGETVDITTYTPPANRIATGNALLSGGNVLGRWTRVFREGDDIQLQVYYDSANRHEPNFADIRNTVDVDFLQRFNVGSRNHFTWGLGLRESHGHEPEVTPGIYFLPSTRTDQLYTAFFQDNITLLPNRLTLEVGTKLLHTNYTGVEPEPSGRLLWTPTETQTIWLAVTRAVRTPSDGERDFYLSSFLGPGAGGLPFFARFNANTSFQSEKLDGYELGYRRLVGKTVFFDLAGFFNQYHDLFSEDITGPIFVENTPAPTHLLLPAEFGNGLMGSTLGGEVAPEWRPTSFWRLRGSYSFLHMVIKKGPNSMDVGTSPIVAGTSPQQQVLVQSSFDLPKRVTFDLAYRYVSALKGISVPAYSTGNARLGWAFGRHWELSVAGENLLQPNHIEFASDPGPNVNIKRSVYGNLVWRSKEN
jgi:iron complex outermembrane receptor protein